MRNIYSNIALKSGMKTPKQVRNLTDPVPSADFSHECPERRRLLVPGNMSQALRQGEKPFVWDFMGTRKNLAFFFFLKK